MADNTYTKKALESTTTTENTKGLTTFGTEYIYTQFNESSSYNIGDRVIHQDARRLYIAPHSPGVYSSSETVAVDDEECVQSTVRADLSFISDSMDEISEITKTPSDFSPSKSYSAGDVVKYTDGKYYVFNEVHNGGWTGTDVTETFIILSGTDSEGMYVDYTIILQSESSTFDFTSITVKAVSLDGTRTVSNMADANGYCILTLRRNLSYVVTVDEKEGWTATCPTGEKLILTSAMLNRNVYYPEDFVSSWSYHLFDKTTYNGKVYKFTAAHSGDWTGKDVSEVSIYKRETIFKYRRTTKDKVTLTLRGEYDGGIPLVGYQFCAMAGDATLFGTNSSNSYGTLYGYDGYTSNSNGTVTCTVPKDKFCGCAFPKLANHNPLDTYVITTVSDRNKEIVATYDSGIRYVVGETETSLADGTAWKEYSLDNYPFDDVDLDTTQWIKNDVQTGSSTTRTHPAHHPLALVHVATNELLAVKFDHTSWELSAGNPLAANTEQVFPHKDRAYDASYYVRPADLSDERGSAVTTVRQWCNYNLLHKDVTTSTSTAVASSYDGPLMTSYMKYDSENWLTEDSGATYKTDGVSPAADYAITSTFNMGSMELHGFIGTYTQMNPLFNLSQAIYGGLKKFGYVANYKTGTYWWSATQNSTTQSKLFTTSFVNANKNITTYNNVKTYSPCLFK